MSTFILTEESAETPIGQLLHSATDPVIEIRDEAGTLLAEIFLRPLQLPEVCPEHLAMATAEIDELRRRRLSDRSNDLTTDQLLAKLRSLPPRDEKSSSAE